MVALHWLNGGRRRCRSMPDPAKHQIEEKRSPTHILVLCSCGWTGQITRKQNARARASKVRGLINRHLKEVAGVRASDG